MDQSRATLNGPALRWLSPGGSIASRRVSQNVLVNLAGVAWTGLATVLATPWYVALLGMEGYGLIGFWLVLQAVLAVFDLGLGATVLREFAAADGDADTARRRDLLLTLEWIYWPIGAALVVILFLSAHWLAADWLTVDSFTPVTVTRSLQLMAVAIGAQFPNALYFSGLAGLQHQGRLNLLQIAGTTLRHGAGVAVLMWRPDPVWFFGVQAIVTAGQTLATRAMLWNANRGTSARPARVEWALVTPLWRFSAGMAVTTLTGMLLANTDRLFLSKLLPATELGKYALAWTAAGFLQLGIQPFYRAYFPRFAQLYAASDGEALRREYLQGCRIVAAVVIPCAAMGWAFAPELFRAWMGTHDPTVVHVFRWLLIGIGATGLMWLPAAFQQAHGWTKLHATMMVTALIAGLAALPWSIGRWGAAGATVVWLVHGLLDATVGLWLMHRRLLRGELGHWLLSVVVPPALCTAPLVLVSRVLLPSGLERWSIAAWIGATALIVMSGAALSTRWPLRTLAR